MSFLLFWRFIALNRVPQAGQIGALRGKIKEKIFFVVFFILSEEKIFFFYVIEYI